MDDKKLKLKEGDDNTVIIEGAVIGAGLSDDGKLAVTAYIGGKHLVMPVEREMAARLVEILQIKIEAQKELLP